MLPFCSNCHVVGHLTVDCPNEAATWWDFISKLRQCDIPDELFGSWLENRSFSSKSTPTNPKDVKAQFISFMQEFVRNPSSLSTPPQSPSVAPPQPTPTGKGKNRFDILYQWTPQVKASIDAEKEKAKSKKNQKKAESKAQNSRGGRGGRGGGRGGRGGGGRGGRGGRGRGAIPAN